ncbi:MAG: hypothetical protein LBO21_04445 [Synergistaceae bacterium]|jgi:hypothetical protein|nr:hypothetical protein [Synergistaceae bacterium]
MTENLRVEAWKDEWESIKVDLELFPYDDVQEALLDVLEKKLYARWLTVYNIKKLTGEISLDTGYDRHYIAKGELSEEDTKACADKLFMYHFKLEGMFGAIFLTAFTLLTFPPLFLLSRIWSVQYQPLVYLLFIIAATLVYSTARYERRWEDRFKCCGIPAVVTIYWLMNSGDALLKTIEYLWLFAAYYYVVMHAATWALMERAKKFFDPFGFSYLIAIRTLK